MKLPETPRDEITCGNDPLILVQPIPIDAFTNTHLRKLVELPTSVMTVDQFIEHANSLLEATAIIRVQDTVTFTRIIAEQLRQFIDQREYNPSSLGSVMMHVPTFRGEKNPDKQHLRILEHLGSLMRVVVVPIKNSCMYNFTGKRFACEVLRIIGQAFYKPFDDYVASALKAQRSPEYPPEAKKFTRDDFARAYVKDLCCAWADGMRIENFVSIIYSNMAFYGMPCYLNTTKDHD